MVNDPKEQFSGRAGYYSKYRPNYPASILQYLERELGLLRNAVVADIGSGTGIFAELLLRNGNRVFGVEPNDDMRTIAESTLSSYENFTSIKGSAEHTTLPAASVDYVTAAQSFHWFDHTLAREELKRILREAGWVVLVWNTRRTSTPFLSAYDEMIKGTSFETRGIRHEDLTEEMLSRFLGKYRTVKLFNFQDCDEASLKGRVLSASYAPLPSDATYGKMVETLSELFKRYQVDGRVRFEYDTELYAGQLR